MMHQQTPTRGFHKKKIDQNGRNRSIRGCSDGKTNFNFIFFFSFIYIFQICAKKTATSEISNLESKSTSSLTSVTSKRRVASTGTLAPATPKGQAPSKSGARVPAPKPPDEYDGNGDDIKFEINIKKTKTLEKDEFNDDEMNPLCNVAPKTARSAPFSISTKTEMKEKGAEKELSVMATVVTTSSVMQQPSLKHQKTQVSSEKSKIVKELSAKGGGEEALFGNKTAPTANNSCYMALTL
ncbi:unnamed protein product [Caenorhabditis angaria]|uniref:Uncharacterized protein n=1 Tax=Caenorhabditis angaria TaxID=860376 RepID=A0A9P1N2R6_9PELO|nr:unnamed protein product [Caenorhabditis angaria]